MVRLISRCGPASGAGRREGAQRGLYSPLFYRNLVGDRTDLSSPMFVEELFWGCAGIGLSIIMPALALSAIGQAASKASLCLDGLGNPD